MRHFLKALAIALLCLFALPVSAQIKHVILISIDGFHPDMYLDQSWPAPNLRALMKSGTYADHCLSVFPSYTYPSHTAMITGAFPASSGVNFNQPIGSKGEWFWDYNAVRVPGLWQVLKSKGMTTAAVEWPVSVNAPVTYNIPEVWADDHPDDRVSEARNHATPGLIAEVEQNATGKLDSTNFNDNYFSLDENAGRAAAYIFQTRKPAFMAVHFACVDGEEHEFGRDADSVRLALAANDRAIGDILEAINKAKLKDSTVVIVTGDHGFATINQIMRPNRLIKKVPAKFIASGGSAFLYRYAETKASDVPGIIKEVTDSLNALPKDKCKLFRIIDRRELDKMGADKDALLALTAQPGLVFSGSVGSAQTTNHGPGTLIQQNKLDGLFIPTSGGHHGYDPNIAEMYTGFIIAGPTINKGGHIKEMRLVDMAPLISKLLNLEFQTPDGKPVPGITTP
ncbi:ectonucleotide pyrophosphatase/phosphodiesterase [Mucilaginibacter sp. dw_454]|uniref:alkaline phosphatase family protein n=1 Tax=Mucilaginibacter sp. dw_454 TaxID=2720079 RepID=UPI001BD4AC8D|nr:ectonucleotide pyrophosphatase/phosphodiesterase [Mucilaginibacter sp. dw_454]